MKICYFIVLFVLFSPTMSYKKKKIIMRTKQKCEEIKCPNIDDPVCVKIKNKQMSDLFIVAINKCEIKYASCHKDINATIVPMENCLHDDKKHQTLRSKRNKRDVDENNSEDGPNDYEVGKGRTDIENEEIELLKGQSGDNENEEIKLLKGESDDNENEENKLLKGESDDNENEEIKLLKGESDDNENETNELSKSQSDDNENETNELSKDQSDDNENETYELLKGQADDKEEINENAKTLNNADENKSELDRDNYEDSVKLKKKSQMNDKTVEEVQTKSEVDGSYIDKLKAVDNVGPDYDQHDEDADLKENNKNCPSVCPSRDVMVCAKCQHNIHRTFLSLCHLRMFACKYTKEKLQLVKREPCVQSAPFLSVFNETKGRIPESGEQDEIHKFIFCRDKKLLNKDDPRCRFKEKHE